LSAKFPQTVFNVGTTPASQSFVNVQIDQQLAGGNACFNDGVFQKLKDAQEQLMEANIILLLERQWSFEIQQGSNQGNDSPTNEETPAEQDHGQNCAVTWLMANTSIYVV
jgi:hypothetical protein